MAQGIRRIVVVAAVAGAMLLVSACAPDRAAEERVPAAYATESPAAVPVVEPEVTAEPEPTHGVCDLGTLVAIWAHYDDDLIFGHSRVSDALEEGWCVTVAYLSAGDAGRGVEYSQGREQGIRDAYDALRGYSGEWSENTDVLNTGVTVEEWRPADDPRLLLLSFRLVDGNIDGSGFASMGYESLAKLAAGDIPTVRDVDGPEQLTTDDITHSLVEILTDSAPDQILTGMPAEAVDLADGDHSDHKTTASFARAAWRSMDVDPSTVTMAIGYQTQNYPVNVEGDVLERKVRAFSAYAVQDPVTANCRDLESCLDLRLFGAWLQREYAKSASEVALP
jgi:LmbE family N-acetylglucosaminyl deacetylase